MHLALLAILAAVAAGPDAGPPPDPLEKPKALFAQRLDRAALDAAIAQLDASSGSEACLLASRAHRFRAVAFELRRRPVQREGGIADLVAARAKALEAWALLEPAAAAKLRSDDVDGALGQASEASLPALLQLAEADLQLAGWRPPLKAVPSLREALRVSARAVAMDPEREQSSPRRIHAAALAALPPLAGGDLAAARFEFERAISASPQLLANRVEMAARYAVKAQDRRLFHALLIAALRLDVDALPELKPEQLLERARALGLLHRERELFRG